MTKVKTMTTTRKKSKSAKKTKRTLTLSEEIDCKLRVFAANQRMSIGSLVEKMIVTYFALDTSEK